MAGPCTMNDLTRRATNDKGVGEGGGSSTKEAIGSFMAGPCTSNDLTRRATKDKRVGYCGVR